MVHKFVNSLKAGKIGESFFLTLLHASDVVYTDVTDDKDYQKKGIDYLIGSKSVDIKFDMRSGDTGNLAFETVSRRRDGILYKEGWLYTSLADSFVYVTILQASVVFFLFSKQDILNLLPLGKTRVVNNYGYESEIVAVPISLLEVPSLICPFGKEFDKQLLNEFVGLM